MKDRWGIFNKDGGRQAFLTNVPLIIANPKKSKTKKRGSIMAKAARSKSGRFVKRSGVKRSGTKRKKNYMSAGALINRPKRRKSNPGAGGMSIMGITLPPMERILYTGAGALAPELVEMLVAEFAPEFTAGEGGQMAVQIGSYVAPPLLALALVGRRAAADVALGELINLSMVGGRKLITESGFFTALPQVAGYITGANVMPMRQLAGYVRRPGLRGYRTSPDRLAKRYPDRNYR